MPKAEALRPTRQEKKAYLALASQPVQREPSHPTKESDRRD
jgi:hypothetical protein